MHVLSPISFGRRQNPAFLVLALGSIGLTVCGRAGAYQRGIRERLDAEGLGLVEIGEFSRFQAMRLTDGFLRVHEINEFSVTAGVSRDAQSLIICRYSGRHESIVHATDEFVLVSVDGRILKEFKAKMVGFSAILAELSPNLTTVAFAGIYKGAISHGIQALDDAGHIRTLVSTTEAKMPKSIGWALNGEDIVYDTSEEIFVYHLPTGISRRLIAGSFPSWSPNGKWIAYRGTNASAYLISPDEGSARPILGGVRIAAGLRWSPDSGYILFTDQDSGAIKILSLSDGTTETIMHPLNGKTEERLRWFYLKGPNGSLLPHTGGLPK